MTNIELKSRKPTLKSVNAKRAFRPTFTNVIELLAALRENNQLNVASWDSWEHEMLIIEPLELMREVYGIELNKLEKAQASKAFKILVNHEDFFGVEAADSLSIFWEDPNSNVGQRHLEQAFA